MDEQPERRLPPRRWTYTELRELQRLARTSPVEAIAAALGRSVQAIRTKAAHLRVRLVYG